ncbi:MAG: hypothetical protein KIT16_06820 [Rhodospirillaceae bacterium]|nr:hypothetical protein [Rhodospirillaceae bacterium]
MRAAGAIIVGLWKGLRSIRWRRFTSVGFLATTVVAVAVVQLVPRQANAPSGAAPLDRANAPKVEYFSFTAALREAYVEKERSGRAALGDDFDDTYYQQNLQALEARVWPEPPQPGAIGLDGPTGVAVDEARLRLLRLYDLGAREAYPRQAAAAQVALECWVTRSMMRRDAAAVADCAARFFDSVVVLEDWLLPVKSLDPFQRRLAREYLAYANYKATVEGDEIDARYFADKGLRAAEAQRKSQPEELVRWFAPDRPELQELAFWRIRLGLVLQKYRTGTRALAAAVALARYDCWVERAAGRADLDHVAKCRGEFVDLMRLLEDRPPAEAETIAIRFPFDQLALPPDERAKLERAAEAAISRNAVVNVTAVAPARGRAELRSRETWRRAETVAAALTGLGIPGERIRLLQRAALPGEKDPGFRRVDIVLD